VRTLYANKVGASIETNATYYDKELMRSIPGSRYSGHPATWTLPLTWAACKQLRGTFRDRLEIGPELRDWAVRHFESRVAPSLALRDLAAPEATSIPLRPPAGLSLYPFQEVDVEWLLATATEGGALLMTPTGGGKTVVTLTWMRNMAIDRALVICKKSAKFDWRDECAKWYPELEPIVVTGSAKERRELIEEAGSYGGLCIVGYSDTRTHSRLAPYGQIHLTEAEKRPKDLNFQPWECVVVDEAHRLGDPTSKQTRACWFVGHQDTVRHRVGLTATPTRKGLDTLWAPLHFADPKQHPSRGKFVDRYAETSTNFWGGQVVGALRPDMEAEFAEIFDPMSRRLPEEVVLPQLPPLVRAGSKKAAKTGKEEYPWEVKEVPLTKEQEAAYKQMAELCLAQLTDGEVIAATNAAAQYVRLGQFASSYAYLGDPAPKRNRKTGEVEMVRPVELQAPSNKIDAFTDDLDDWLAQEDSVIVFATSRKLINLLSAKLLSGKRKVPHSLIVGGQTDIQRHEQKLAFQNGDVPVILVVISAGGESITLTRGRVMAFLQRSWARWEDRQAQGRGRRIGSEVHDSILRVDYVSPGTVDVGQLDVLEAKEDVMQQVTRDRETVERMMAGGHPF
jgi:superfamily II DNA or RNA helicase